MAIHVHERNKEMVRLWDSGESLTSLATRYGISYQRVNQIINYIQNPSPCPNACDRNLPLEPPYGRCCSHCDAHHGPHTWQCDKRKGILRRYYAWFDGAVTAMVHRIEAVSAEQAADQLRVLYPQLTGAVLVVDSTSTSLSTNPFRSGKESKTGEDYLKLQRDRVRDV